MSERDRYEPGVPCWVDTLQDDPRAYHILEDLNTRPAVTYLARVRDPKP